MKSDGAVDRYRVWKDRKASPGHLGRGLRIPGCRRTQEVIETLAVTSYKAVRTGGFDLTVVAEHGTGSAGPDSFGDQRRVGMRTSARKEHS